MTDKKRVTIHQVASEAGVSRQTVSRVINNRPDVAPETRKRVQEVINRLGYQPSAIARSLSQQRSYTFGVVTSGLKFIGPSRTLNGITEKAEELGYGLLLKELLSFETNDIQPLLRWLLARQVDGILWAVPQIGNNRLWMDSQLPELSVPTIFLTMEPREDVLIVSVDNYLGGRLAVEHLVEIGRRNIAHVSGPLNWWEARERKRGWEDVLLENKNIQKVEGRFWEEGTWGSGSGERAIRKLLEKYPEMDAVFVGNDQMALSVMQVASRLGMKIPEDLAVVGFDGIPDSAYYWPPLSTVYQNQYQLGCTAVRELVQLVERQREAEEEFEDTPKQMLIKPELIIRESSQII
jgi:DNA-binding LacI/PurR family transcriptional regulator